MNKRTRFFIILALIGFSAVGVYPTVRWYFLVPAERRALADAPRAEIRGWAVRRARVDLAELAGLARDQEPVPERYDFLIDRAADNLELIGRPAPDRWTADELLGAFLSRTEVFDLIEANYREAILELKDSRNRIVQLGLDLSGGMTVTLQPDEADLAARLERVPSGVEVAEAVDIAGEVIRNRIDQFGVTEPQIRTSDSNRIIVDIPGANDRERVNALLLGKGSLTFRIVDDEATSALLQLQAQRPGWSPESDGVPAFVPAGTEVLLHVERDQYGIDQPQRYIGVYTDMETLGLDGSFITDANPSRDAVTGRPTANFVLDTEGAERFARLTRDNTGRSMAIVMDDQVRAYAVINREIATGQAQILGFDEEQARDVSTVLRTAALPVDLEIVNQQIVGASLGEQAIQLGIYSIGAGMALVLLFMVVVYKGAGCIADIALLLNLFFILAMLSAFNLTLTLTSIAGIILTVGMAVDANVIIFERIKEEYRLGKGAAASVRAGFEKAFWTVTDANVTTFIAAIFLSLIGTGAVQGFAVTLAVGIASSMFTALVVTRLFFDFSTQVLKRSKLSIAWRNG